MKQAETIQKSSGDRNPQAKKQVLISGYYGYGNMGDDTILHTICREYGEFCDLTVLSMTPRKTAKDYGISAIPRFSLWKLHGAMRHAELLLFGGGSLLQDRTSTRSLLYYLAVIRMALRRGLPVVVYANGIGPVRGKLSRRLVAKTLDRVTAITLRDQDSLLELQAMGLRRRDAVVTADPVFSLDPVSQEKARALLDQTGIPRELPLMGISLRSSSQQEAEKLAELYDGICRETGLVPVFLCMQPSVDFPAAQRVMEKMQVKGYLLPEEISAREMMGIIGCMELVTSMRLHALIFAAAAGTPVMGFDYDPKVSSLLQSLGMSSFGTVEQLRLEEAQQQAVSAYRNAETLRRQVQTAAERLREQAKENNQILSRYLKSE